jgi:hypothetical protein
MSAAEDGQVPLKVSSFAARAFAATRAQESRSLIRAPVGVDPWSHTPVSSTTVGPAPVDFFVSAAGQMGVSSC